ncbi:MAG: zinc-regulated TonB-dependent outer membrane receptor [Nitrospira sp.]|nr:zinc-regulated TonB-dependent outer membrane receptor [Candidatus Manganitrophaceae bacterium]HIL33924.1 zinc-regulated TonB-dependent outer membrane receptor [Candidatus Manganitrophaceae bacterium]
MLIPFVLILSALLGITLPVFGAPISPQSKRSQNFNPNISLDGLFSASYFSESENLQFGAHDPGERGFTLQNLELTFAGIVDPFFRAEGHLIFGLKDGESFLEVEEAFLTTLGLPYGFQVMAGQFFTRFGRLNRLHPHAWDFVDQTIVNTLMFGGDGLRTLGVQVSALLPLPFYLELIGSAQNARGETASSFLSTPEESFAGRPILDKEIESGNDLLYMGRLKSSFDLSETITWVVGTSHLFGSNGTGIDTETRIYGIDLFIKCKPLMTDHSWPFVSLQGEVIRRSYEAGATNTLPEERFNTDGFYIQSLYGFKRRWVTGVRYGQADATRPDDPRTGDRWRISPNLTFYPSEFSKIRLQYNFDRSDDRADPIHAVFVQYEFLIGAHGAHAF